MSQRGRVESDPVTAQTARFLSRRGQRDRFPIECVYVAGTPSEAAALGRMLAPVGARVHYASTVAEAGKLVGRLQCRVLLSEAGFEGDGWRDVRRMLRREHLEISMLLVLPRFDGQVWVEALEQGCYEVLLKPLNAARLQHSVEDAYWYSCRRAGPRMDKLHFR